MLQFFKSIKHKLLSSDVNKVTDEENTSNSKHIQEQLPPQTKGTNSNKCIENTPEKKAEFLEIDDLEEMFSVKGDSDRSVHTVIEEAEKEERTEDIMIQGSNSQDGNEEYLLADWEEPQPNSPQQLKNQQNHPCQKQIKPKSTIFSNILSAKDSLRLQRSKILIEKASEIRKPRKIVELCAICRKQLRKADSLQLACTHRYHKTCAIRMQWKMNYKCDLCTFNNLKKSRIDPK